MNVREPHNDSLLGNVTWTLSNLCRGKPQPELVLVEPAIPALCYLACNSTVDDITADALWALSYVADGNDERIDAIIRADTEGALMKKVVECVKGNKAQLISPSLRILGNFVSGTEQQTQAVIDAGALGAAMTTLQSSKKTLRKEMCWMLSNIAAGTQDQISTLVKTVGVVERLVAFAIDADWETRKEAIWAISNVLTGGSDGQVAHLVGQGAIAAMASVLDIPSEGRMVIVALDAIDNILTVSERKGYSYGLLFDECGGIEKVETLQTHNDQKIYEKAIEILDRYFGEDDAEDENLAPAFNGNSFAFGMSSPPPPKNLFESSPAPENPVYSFGSANNYNFFGN
jgi:importin subunit alpha-1